MRLASVILAAGKGTRMKSRFPKVLHKVCGIPMICHVLKTARDAGSDRIVVVAGYGGEMVAKEVGEKGEVVFQHEQLGTAHALLQAEKSLKDFKGDIIVLCGDTPLVSTETLKKLVLAHRDSGAFATILTAVMDNPAGYGRVIRSSGGMVNRIVEQKDATVVELSIREVNTGVYCFKADGLFSFLALIDADNVQGEYYLPDLIGKYVQDGRGVAAVSVADPLEVMGINDRSQLATAQASLWHKINHRLMISGVTIADPTTVFIDAEVTIGRDTVIYPHTILQGKTVIGEGCVIGPFTQIISARLQDNVEASHSVIDGSDIGNNCVIGPYSYIRPGSVIKDRVKVGDFVELKKAQIGCGSKIPHLSYVGDAEVGENVNIGAGTITCNYDGDKKWPTVIGDKAFIGSNTNLIAPVRIGCGAVTGAGSTITKDVPDGALGITREKQKNISNWTRGKKGPDK